MKVSATRLARFRKAGSGGATGLGVEPNSVISTLVGAAPVRPVRPYSPHAWDAEIAADAFGPRGASLFFRALPA